MKILRLLLIPKKKATLTLILRIPSFSEKNELTVNGDLVNGVVPGIYQKISREWKKGDIIRLRFDLTARVMTSAQPGRFISATLSQPGIGGKRIRGTGYGLNSRIML